MTDSGHYAYLQQRKAAVLARNPHLVAKITGTTPKPGKPVEPLKVRPIYERGRFIPMPLANLIAFVGKQIDLHHDAICGHGRTRKLVDARSCIAVLATDFAPRMSMRGIDDGLLRGEGSCAWYRERHTDRLKTFPEYAALYARCFVALAEQKP